MKGSKVAIIGAGFVGSTAAYALFIDGCASEIAIIDIMKDKAEGHALDLSHGMLFTPFTRVTYGDSYELCKGADIIVITSGANQKQGETRLDLTQKNAQMLKEIIPQITMHNKDCIILMVSNPLDALTYLALKYSGFPEQRVMGTGTILDTARFRHLLGQYYSVNPQSINAYILGEHGDSEFPAWSTANIGGIPVKDFPGYDKRKLSQIFDNTKNAAYEIISRKGATYYAIGLAITKIVRSILTDQHDILPVSCLLKDYYGISDVCLSIPVVIHKGGIKEKIKITLNDEEQKHLLNSAEVIRKTIKAAS